jgi:hypothetical protein
MQQVVEKTWFPWEMIRKWWLFLFLFADYPMDHDCVATQVITSP